MALQIFTSESVGAGHPDKICDQISDLILDRILAKDQAARVACEVLASNRLIVIAGEITTTAYVDVVATAWDVLLKLGYDENDFTIISNLHAQSPDIAQGIALPNHQIGAGDQGIMFGYACQETPQLMPLPIVLAHALMQRAEKLRQSGAFLFAKADMKSQVSINYQNPQAPQIATIVISVQHTADYHQATFESYIKSEIIAFVVRQYNLNFDFKTLINPAGRFVTGGPIGDAGLTGRKIIVDTYGGRGRHGGGAFSGKDATKVDRSGAYAARWIAKNLVQAGVAREIEVQLSYAIGLEDPIAIAVETFQTSQFSDAKIGALIRAVFDLRPQAIITALNLKTTRYFPTATFGHFGRTDLDLPWEKLNKVAEIKKWIAKAPIITN